MTPNTLAGAVAGATAMTLVGGAFGIHLRDDMGNMSMVIDTAVSDAQRYFNQGLRFTSTFKFGFAVESYTAALALDPACAMCEWGRAFALGQNFNDALVMALEPWFLDNEPLAYAAVSHAQELLDSAGTGSRDEYSSKGRSVSLTHTRDNALVSALALKFVATVEEYKSHFVDGLPTSLNLAYAEAMADAVVRSGEESWPDHTMVLLLSADAWMNVSPWDYWVSPHTMRPNGEKARSLLEKALIEDPNNAWAIHLYIHLMEAGGEAEAAVGPAQKLQFLVPGAPHLQHMPSHVEFRSGLWHKASEANLRSVALPDVDAEYPEHNLDMLMWALGVEGRQSESKVAGERLTALEMPRILEGYYKPFLPPERYFAQETLHLVAFADWEGVRELDAPPEVADFPMAVFHFARSLAYIVAKDWGGYRQEQGLITAGLERMQGRMDYYALYNAPALTHILDLLARAEGLRSGAPVKADGATSSLISTASHDSSIRNDGAGRRRVLGDLHPSNGEEHLSENIDYNRLRHNRGAAERALMTDGKESRHAAELESLDTAETITAAAGNEELGLLREAVQLHDALGYDEPPQLPVPVRLYLAAALLRGGASASSDGEAAAGTAIERTERAEEAETILRELNEDYPNMGRTFLGLWQACSMLGKHDEAREFRRQFLSSWKYAEIWLDDSAHVGGRQISCAERSRHDCEDIDDDLSLVAPSAASATHDARRSQGLASTTRTARVSTVSAAAIVLLSLAALVVIARNNRARRGVWKRIFSWNMAPESTVPRARVAVGETDSLVSSVRRADNANHIGDGAHR